MGQNFVEALYNLKRKSQLTGNPLTSRNVDAMTSGYLTSATEMMNNQRAVDLQEDALAQTAKDNAAALAEAKREAADRNQQSTIESAAQMQAADVASKNTLTGNLLNTGVSLGGGYLMNNPATVKAGVNAAGQLTGLWGGNIADAATAAEAAGETAALGAESASVAAEGAFPYFSSQLAGAAAPTGAAAASTTSGAAGAQLAGTAATEGAATLSGAGSAALSAAPYAAAGYLAAKYGGQLLTSATGEHTLVGRIGKTISDPLQGVGRTLVNEFMPEGKTKNTIQTIMDVANPLGWAFKQLGCIIVTACTDRHSPEVEIAREYRDRFMSPEQLRGYYMIAETVMPWVVRHRAFVKKHLVDRLVEYGSYHLGKTEKVPCRASSCVTRGFLMLCGFAGRRKRVFVRCNGEGV